MLQPQKLLALLPYAEQRKPGTLLRRTEWRGDVDAKEPSNAMESDAILHCF
jgi:hypothetical protein